MPASTPLASRRSRRAPMLATESRAARCGPRPGRSPTRSCCSRARRRRKECKRPTDGMTLFYTDLDRTKVEVRRIHKMGRNAVDSNARCSSTTCSCRTRTGSARRARASSTSSTASTPSASWWRARRSASVATRCGGRRPMPASGSCSAADRAEPGHPASAGRELDLPRIRLLDGFCAPAGSTITAALRAEANAAKFLAGRAAFDAATRAVL